MSKKNVEAIYPLSPSQQGMLLETLADSASGRYIEQSVWNLTGAVNIAAFEQAWQRVVNRHSILRTCFVWKNQDEPLQVVLRQVKMQIEREDWHEFSASQQQENLEEYLRTARLNGFNLARAPLMRLALFQTGKTTYQFVWTFHHILMDGWCLPLIVKEVLAFYEAFNKGQDLTLEPGNPYRNYITWLNQQDLSQAEVFWRRTLQGFTEPTPLGREVEPQSFVIQENRYGELKDRLPAAVTAALQALVLQQRLTMNSVMQGVWTLLLSSYSGNNDVVFGATVSGRPTDLIGVETMIGFFINTLPIRIKVSPETPLWSWLKEIQFQQLEQRGYEYCSAGQIQQWSELPGALPLYESILVFENYPVALSELKSSDLTIDMSSSRFIGAQTKYALTILVLPGAELEVKIIYDRARFDDADMTLILNHFFALLKGIIAAPEQHLSTLLDNIPAAQIPKVRPIQTHVQKDLKERFVAPRTPTENALAAIWKEILGLEQIGIHDNFFDLGGHSIIAMQLMAKIQQQFGKSFPVTAFFQAPTIAQFAQLINQQELPEAFTPLVGIQPRGEKFPFFCMHAVDGGVFYYHDLARHLGTRQPFYGLQAFGLEPGTPIFTRFEDMAAEYINAMRSVYPKGPYLVGGYSSGGILAYEVAQQLRRFREPVALVAIIDITPQYTIFEGANHFFAFMQAISGLLNIDLFPFYRELRGIDVNEGREGITRDLQSLSDQERLSILWECVQKTGSLPPGIDAERIDRAIKVFTANTEAVRNYTVHPYQGRIALFRSLHDLVRKLDDPTFGWGQYTSPPIEIYDIPGDHFTIIREPSVKVLAEKLRVCLSAAKNTK